MPVQLLRNNPQICEDEIGIDREPITVVRANRFLYDMTEKFYVNEVNNFFCTIKKIQETI